MPGYSQLEASEKGRYELSGKKIILGVNAVEVVFGGKTSDGFDESCAILGAANGSRVVETPSRAAN